MPVECVCSCAGRRVGTARLGAWPRTETGARDALFRPAWRMSSVPHLSFMQVTPWNVEKLREAVLAGPGRIPGAVAVEDERGRVVMLRKDKKVGMHSRLER